MNTILQHAGAVMRLTTHSDTVSDLGRYGENEIVLGVGGCHGCSGTVGCERGPASGQDMKVWVAEDCEDLSEQAFRLAERLLGRKQHATQPFPQAAE